MDKDVQPQITDAELLELLSAGLLSTGPECGHVFTHFNNAKRRLSTWKNDRGYVNVCIRYKRRRRTVKVHKLIWMAANGACVPDGYDVHHKDRVRDRNCLANLEAIQHAENLARRYEKAPGDDY